MTEKQPAETPAEKLATALEIGDRFVAALSRCDGLKCETHDVKQIIGEIIRDNASDELDSARESEAA